MGSTPPPIFRKPPKRGNGDLARDATARSGDNDVVSSIYWQKVLAHVIAGVMFGALLGIVVGAVLDAILPGYHLVQICAVIGPVLLTAYWLSPAGNGPSGLTKASHDRYWATKKRTPGIFWSHPADEMFNSDEDYPDGWFDKDD